MNEPALNWWAGFVLKKRERIILLVKKWNTRYLKRNEKFGIAIPNNVKEALELDKENGNTLWDDAIATETELITIRCPLSIIIGRTISPCSDGKGL